MSFATPNYRSPPKAFADRRYEPDGTLRSRKHEDALIHDPAEAARQALSIVERGFVVARNRAKSLSPRKTICIHGDTPGAPQIAIAVAQTLRQAGVRLAPLSP